jgi:hypothetical protein
MGFFRGRYTTVADVEKASFVKPSDLPVVVLQPVWRKFKRDGNEFAGLRGWQTGDPFV